MSLLVETIKSENGRLLNIDFHNERLNRSICDLFGRNPGIRLEKEIVIPDFVREGIYKCRVEYGPEIGLIEFVPYKLKLIRSLKIIEDNTIQYRYKYIDREQIEKLYSCRMECDDILIIKNGMVTDTSYANVIFRDGENRWVTPSSCLLPGTRRSFLLKKGVISESNISYFDISKFREVKLINAMLGIDETDSIPVENLVW